MVTNNYHDNQDIPNMDDPDTVLALFQQQASALVSVKDEADADLHQIEESLGKTFKFAQDKGLTKLEERVQQQWKLAQLQHGRVTHLTAALSGAGTAIQALHQQRDAVTAEHARLVEALAKGDEDHPELRAYAEGIRQDEAEYLYYNDATEIDFEFVYERYTELVVENWDVSFDVARRLIDVAIGDDSLTDVQRDAFVTFLGTLNAGQAAS